MAVVVLKNAALKITNVTATTTSDLSDHVRSIKVTDNPDALTNEAMGSNYHTFTFGLRNGNIEVTFYQDRASGKTDATLAPMVGSTSDYTVVAFADGTTVGATNPSWTVTKAQLSGEYNGISGNVGEVEMTTVRFVPGSGGSLTRATS